MRQVTRALGGSLLVASLFVAACDSSSYSDEVYPDGSSSGSPFVPGSTTSAPPDAARATSEPCAASKEGTSCAAGPAEGCEQKTLANPRCNVVLTCDYDFSWRTSRELTDCATDCPAAFATEAPSACAGPHSDSRICEYQEGTCGCAPLFASPSSDGGDAGSPVDAAAGDAGDADADGDTGNTPIGYEWRCVTPAAGCPRTRPANGASCVRPMSCDYGECVFRDGVRMDCEEGFWRSHTCGE